MKKSKFSDSQILSTLKQHEAGISIAELSREHVSEYRFNLSVAAQKRWNGRIVGERD